MDESVAEGLKALPRWAVVAFAARCARRVAPLFQRAWPEAPASDVAAVLRAVRLAEECAARAGARRAAARESALAADLASHHASFASAAVSRSGAYEAAHTAANAAGTAAYPDDARTGAWYAAVDAAAAVLTILGQSDAAIRADLDALVAAAQRDRWTDATPVPPDSFAPLPPDPVAEDEAARREAYYEWERRGRPALSPQEQEQMYYEALARVRGR
jgi:hypothetical protein